MAALAGAAGLPARELLEDRCRWGWWGWQAAAVLLVLVMSEVGVEFVMAMVWEAVVGGGLAGWWPAGNARGLLGGESEGTRTGTYRQVLN